MERQGCGSGYEMRMQVGEVQAENGITVAMEGGGSTADADVSRRRKLEIEEDRSDLKKKRISDSATAFLPPPLPENFMDQGRLKFLFFKKLHNSDVSHVGRIVLPKKPAETCLPRLFDNHNIVLSMNDMDTGDVWSFKFRYWPNNRSRMYVLEGTWEFIEKHNLEAGDYMLMYKDLVYNTYVIRAVKAPEDDEEYDNKEATDVKGNKDADLIDNSLDLPMYVGNGFEFEAFAMPITFPNMEGPSLKNDDIYFSDILNSFGTLEEFMINNYPPIQKSTSFENLSDEDLSQV